MSERKGKNERTEKGRKEGGEGERGEVPGRERKGKIERKNAK